jgi:hypothetical protein
VTKLFALPVTVAIAWRRAERNDAIAAVGAALAVGALLSRQGIDPSRDRLMRAIRRVRRMLQHANHP